MIDHYAKTRDYQQDVPCNLCGSHKQIVIYASRYTADESFEGVKRNFREKGGDELFDRVVKCEECGLIYLSPRFFDDFYLNEYKTAGIRGYKEQFVKQNPEREAGFIRALKMVTQLIPGKGKLLDVGTADGTFLRVAQHQGWEVFGCEPNTWFCEQGEKNYNIKIDCGTLLDQDYPEQSFDVITLWDVIEHAVDPKKNIQSCFSLLRPGGYMIITYPDIDSWVARLMGRKWVYLMSVHLYYFNQGTLKRMIVSEGFSVEKTVSHFQSLRLGYLTYRLQVLNRLISVIMGKVSRLLLIDNINIPYWAGINCIVCRKKGEKA